MKNWNFNGSLKENGTRVLTDAEGVVNMIGAREDAECKFTNDNGKLKMLLKIPAGGGTGGSIDVDDEISDISENPVQNKVITELIKKLGVFTQDELDNLLDKKNPDGITDFIEDSTEEEFKGIDTVERVENSSIDNMFI